MLKSGYFSENGDLQFYTIEEGNEGIGNDLGKKSADKIKRMLFY